MELMYNIEHYEHTMVQADSKIKELEDEMVDLNLAFQQKDTRNKELQDQIVELKIILQNKDL